jgi:hypothetical protein
VHLLDYATGDIATNYAYDLFGVPLCEQGVCRTPIASQARPGTPRWSLCTCGPGPPADDGEVCQHGSPPSQTREKAA